MLHVDHRTEYSTEVLVSSSSPYSSSDEHAESLWDVTNGHGAHGGGGGRFEAHHSGFYETEEEGTREWSVTTGVEEMVERKGGMALEGHLCG